METLLQDIRYGLRVLLKSPGLTAAAVLALTLGIGANTAIFSVVNGVMLKPLPFAQPERLVRIYERAPQFDEMSISYPNFLDWRSQDTLFEGISLFHSRAGTLTGGTEPQPIVERQVSANFFDLLGVGPALGRSFRPEEDSPAAEPTAIISNALWQSRFGADPAAPGKSLIIDDKPYTIIGVLPARFQFYSHADIYLPLGSVPTVTLNNRELRNGMRGIARLKPSVRMEQALAEMTGIESALARQYPEANAGYTIGMHSVYEDVVREVRPALLVLFGAVAFVLLIACANIAHLLLARASARQREIAIRTALGASRVRIIRQLLTESVILALTGGGLGLLLALWGADLLVRAAPGAIPRSEDLGIDLTVLGFTLLVSLLTGIFFGLAPALQFSRPDLNESLKDGGRGSSGGRRRVRDALVVFEVSIALVLLICAGLMLRSLLHLGSVNPGFDPNHVLAMEIPLSPTRYSDPQRIRTFYRQLLDRVKAVPGVRSAAVNTDLPLSGDDSEIPFWAGNRPRPAHEDMSWAMLYPSSPEYLDVMGIPLLKGRFFNEQDTEKSRMVVVIDETLARELYAGQDPIGQRITIEGAGGLADLPCEVVGVVGHVKHTGLDTDAQSKIQYQFYISVVQVPDQFLPLVAAGTYLLARGDTDSAGLISAVKREVLAADKDQPVYSASTMAQVISASIAQQRFAMLLLGLFAAIALVLAAVGIYGVMSYSVTQRSHEIGIRMALGAKRADVLKLVVGQGMALVAIGVGAGLAAAFALTRLMASLLYGVSATDPLTFAAIALVLAGVALLANLVPARRATKVDPMIALRYE